jgi:hypothetical protein
MDRRGTMADYFFMLDAAQFEGEVRPALADVWRQHRFDVAHRLCIGLLPAAREFAERYHIGDDESLLARIAAGPVSFERTLWRTLVSEILLFTALEIPEFQVNADTLTCLLAPHNYVGSSPERARYAPIEQALKGSRDLTFGAAIYRPEHAGYNATDDVKRLATFLDAVRPESWTVAGLASLSEVPSEDRADELAFAREWFPALVGLYERAAGRGAVIVYESIF